MQTIETRYFGATANRASKVKATATNGKSVYVGYNDYDRSQDAHIAAVKKLCDKLGWVGKMQSGNLRNGSLIWVFIDTDTQIKVD